MISRRMTTVYLISIMVLSIFSGSVFLEANGMWGSFGGGTGVSDDPYVIEDVHDLQNMALDPDAHYVLKNDIDATGTKTWNAGAGFIPVGKYQDEFTGSLDGKNFTIRGLFINRPSTNIVGLFGIVSGKAMIKNLNLVDIDITGHDHTGGIIGYHQYGTVSNCYTSGNVIATNMRAGGIAGFNQGTVADCYSAANVSALISAGGIIGYHQGRISNCYSRGDVDGTGSVGGLVGSCSGRISNSHYNIDNVQLNGGKHLTIGGLFDDQYQDWMSNGLYLNISDYSNSIVPSGTYYDISNPQGISDLLGFADVNGYRFRLSADIDLYDSPGLYVPYFGASEFDGGNHTISNLFLDLDLAQNVGMFGHVRDGEIKDLKLVDIDVTGYSMVGGILGYKSSGSVFDCHVTGKVSGDSSIGGLIGSFNGETMSNCSTSTDVIGTGAYVGGLMGYNNGGIVSDCHATGSVSGGRIVGGLIGSSSRVTVSNCYATGDVSGHFDYVGGLIGENQWSTVSECYATGTVSGEKWGIGGLIGNNDGGIVSECYATGTVIGIDNAVGGFIGDNTGAVSNCYSTGNVSGTGTYFGGLVGYQFGTISNCFWDMEASGRTSSYGGTGKTTAEMKTRNTFTDAGWYFNITWHIVENYTYPFLRWQDAVTPIADAGPDQIVNIEYDGEVNVHFSGSKSIDDLGILYYTWSFLYDGSEILLYGENVDFMFGIHGIYDVTLNVTDASGNWNTDTMKVAAVDIIHPIADAGPDRTVDEGTVVTFDGRGSSDNVEIVDYMWLFIDDGQPISLSGIETTYQFNNPGSFAVTLKVIDAANNWVTDTMNIIVLDITPPIAYAGPDLTVDEGTVVAFDGSGSLDNVGIVNYTWTFVDDGLPVTLYGVEATYIFNNTGSFVVTLNITDTAGHWHIDSLNVTVLDVTSPFADAGPDLTVDEGATVIFNGSGSLDNVGIEKWTWTFYDGGLISLDGVNSSYRFNDPGVFTVTLNVTDAVGNWQTDTVTITVRDITVPVAVAGEDRTVPAGMTVFFNGTLSSDNDKIKDFSWTFTYDGEKRILEGEVVSFIFDKGGVYEIVLNVSDRSGNTDKDAFIITVIDTGKVSGIVKNSDGVPIEGATVEITTSAGTPFTIDTETDGSFSVEIPYGPFTWKITKEGYKTISGIGTVGPMEEETIDLSEEPMIREKEKSESNSVSITMFIILIIVIIFLIGLILLLLLRKKEPGDVNDWDDE